MVVIMVLKLVIEACGSCRFLTALFVIVAGTKSAIVCSPQGSIPAYTYVSRDAIKSKIESKKELFLCSTDQIAYKPACKISYKLVPIHVPHVCMSAFAYVSV